jgi:serine/threonine protein kinase
MSPESIREQVYSEKSDVWAYAMTLFEVLSGQEPFQGEDLLTVATKVRDTAACPDIPDDCPSWLKPIIQDCWSAEPTGRPSFNEIVQRLEVHRPKNFTESPMAATGMEADPRAPKRTTTYEQLSGGMGGYSDADNLKTKKSKSKETEN